MALPADVCPRTGAPFSLVRRSKPIASNPIAVDQTALGCTITTNDADRVDDAPAARAGTTSEPTKLARRVLHAVVPPLSWVHDGVLYTQSAADQVVPGRADAEAVAQQLEFELQARGARPARQLALARTQAAQWRASAAAAREGAAPPAPTAAELHACLCPVREALFSQAFDEVIRQATLNCPERGLLLSRARDERRMTLAAWVAQAEEAQLWSREQAAHASTRELPAGARIWTGKRQPPGACQRLPADKMALADGAARLSAYDYATDPELAGLTAECAELHAGMTALQLEQRELQAQLLARQAQADSQAQVSSLRRTAQLRALQQEISSLQACFASAEQRVDAVATATMQVSKPV